MEKREENAKKLIKKAEEFIQKENYGLARDSLNDAEGLYPTREAKELLISTLTQLKYQERSQQPAGWESNKGEHIRKAKEYICEEKYIDACKVLNKGEKHSPTCTAKNLLIFILVQQLSLQSSQPPAGSEMNRRRAAGERSTTTTRREDDLPSEIPVAKKQRESQKEEEVICIHISSHCTFIKSVIVAGGYGGRGYGGCG